MPERAMEEEELSNEFDANYYPNLEAMAGHGCDPDDNPNLEAIVRHDCAPDEILNENEINWAQLLPEPLLKIDK